VDTLFNIQESARTVYFYVLYGYQNKQRIFSCTALSDCDFITETECVYCAVRTGSLNVILSTFRLKGLETERVLHYLPTPWSRLLLERL